MIDYTKAWPHWVPKEFDVYKPTSEYIKDWADLLPDKTALIFYDQKISYSELNQKINQFAHGLVSLRVEIGDRIALYMENCPLFVIAYFAIHRAGAVAVPINPMLKKEELEFQLRDSGAKIVVISDRLRPEVEAIKGPTNLKYILGFEFAGNLKQYSTDPLCRIANLGNLALLQYTGGTTGISKAAMIDHKSLSYVNIGSMHWYQFREDDVHLGVTPFFHIMGQQLCMCTPLVSGGALLVFSTFEPTQIIKEMKDQNCTTCIGSTTLGVGLMEHLKYGHLDSLRCLLLGGMPITECQVAQFKEMAPNAIFGEGYGLTETVSHGGVSTPPHRYKKGFIGIPHLNTIKIIDLETGKDLDSNEEGEIVIKGPAMMSGYWNQPEETKKILVDGWLHTGDIGLLDEEGYLKFLGRKKELIKCSGFSVFPAEVEALLLKNEVIKEAAVIGVPDPYRGETPKAFIVLKPKYISHRDEDFILAWCQENIPAYKRPRSVQIVTELPKNSAGKILRRLL